MANRRCGCWRRRFKQPAMAKALLACLRAGGDAAEALSALARDVHDIGAVLTGEWPERSAPVEPVRIAQERHGVIAACFSPTGSIRLVPGAVALGRMTGREDDWDCPGAPVGDGTFALLRSSESAIELVTDAFATRTIWYYHDAERFLAASSQRALVMLLGSFIPNRAAVPWMLANGFTGPAGGWDARMQRVPANARVLLDRASWKVRVEAVRPESASDAATPCADDVWLRRFLDVLESSASALALDGTRWKLPLSGGYDSRLLAGVFGKQEGLGAITWDLAQKPGRGNPEMEVAAGVADRLGLPHARIAMRPSSLGWEVLFDRFVRAGDGLTDAIGGYLDGFEFWAALARDGVDGILRGDEPFGGRGWLPVRSERDVRLGLGLARLAENPATAWLVDALPDAGDQDLPAALRRRDGENLADWRHRLFVAYRVPVCLAALTEVKTGFVEVLNPLQARSIAAIVAALPRHLRDDKELLVRAAERLVPGIPYASLRESDEMVRFLRQDEALTAIRAALVGDDARDLLGDAAVEGLLQRLPAKKAAASPTGLTPGRGSAALWRRIVAIVREKVIAALPSGLKRRLRAYAPVAPLDPVLIAFRAFLCVRINAVMRGDARVLAEARA